MAKVGLVAGTSTGANSERPAAVGRVISETFRSSVLRQPVEGDCAVTSGAKEDATEQDDDDEEGGEEGWAVNGREGEDEVQVDVGAGAKASGRDEGEGKKGAEQNRGE